MSAELCTRIRRRLHESFFAASAIDVSEFRDSYRAIEFIVGLTKLVDDADTPLVSAAIIAFWAGGFLAVIGSAITFYPGAECGWYCVSGIMIACGLVSPKRKYRVAAFVLCLLCFFAAYAGYIRGIEYKQRASISTRVSQLSQSNSGQLQSAN